MRKLALWLAFLLTCTLAFPAFADDDDDLDWGEDTEEDSEDTAGVIDGEEVRNRFLIGLNSTLTWPADFVMGTVQPREEFDELPLGVVTKYPVGFFQGTLMSMFRFSTGVLDLVFSPLTPLKMLSPEPRYMLFEDVEHDEY